MTPAQEGALAAHIEATPELAALAAAGLDQPLADALNQPHPDAVWSPDIGYPGGSGTSGEKNGRWTANREITVQQALAAIDPAEILAMDAGRQGWLNSLMMSPVMDPSNLTVLTMAKRAFPEPRDTEGGAPTTENTTVTRRNLRRAGMRPRTVAEYVMAQAGAPGDGIGITHQDVARIVRAPEVRQVDADGTPVDDQGIPIPAEG